MSGINLSDWALRHRSMVFFLTLVSLLAGIQAYRSLGRAEDPNFTMRLMVVRTLWPGATANEVREQVSTPLERRLVEIPGVHYVKSMSKAGDSFVYVFLQEHINK